MPRPSVDLKPYRAGRRVRLGRIDPASKPLASSSREADDSRLTELCVQIDVLHDLLYANGAAGGTRKLLVVLQGLDTSGKDGTARSVLSRCSPLGVRVEAFKAPSEAERARDFLWRVHQVVPRAGEIVLFNRSHYEDVLVPYVEGWITSAERDRRLAHIVAFERLLTDTGTAVLKCCLHISKAEQKLRLQARLDDPAKRWKFDPNDLKTRAKWKAYTAAYDRAMSVTSTTTAPWYVIPADSKSNRNLMVVTLVRDVLRAMKLRSPKPGYDPAAITIR